jgi:hypothetical protein
MKIDRKLNLIIPIYADIDAKEGEDAPIIARVHAVPLPEEVVERYFMVLAQTYSAIFSQGLGLAGGPAVAMRLLRQVATTQGAWADEARTGTVGVESGVVNEMRRLTTVMMTGGQAVPLQVAVDQGFISADDQREVENAIVFFMLVSAMLGKAQRRSMVQAAAGLWGAQTSFLDSTAFMTSLRTSTVGGNTGGTSPAPAPATPAPATATVDGKPASVPR